MTPWLVGLVLAALAVGALVLLAGALAAWADGDRAPMRSRTSPDERRGAWARPMLTDPFDVPHPDEMPLPAIGAHTATSAQGRGASRQGEPARPEQPARSQRAGARDVLDPLFRRRLARPGGPAGAGGATPSTPPPGGWPFFSAFVRHPAAIRGHLSPWRTHT